MTGTVLILGGSGRFGRHAADAFWKAGWTVRQFDRKTDDLMQAAQGTDVIVNAWNPPYPKWEAKVPVLHSAVQDAALAADATVIIPGNVYVFGDGTGPDWSDSTPHLAQNPLGKIRVAMEASYRNRGVRSIILRAGDFIDTETSGNWFDAIMAAKLAKGRFTYPGPTDAKHAWAYLPDITRAAVQLAEMRDQLARFEDVAFPGYTLTGQQLFELVQNGFSGDLKMREMSWLPLYLAAPFWKMGAKLIEMRYLWKLPHRLDGTKFNSLLPGFKHTAPEAAIAMAIALASELDVDPDEAVAAGL